MSVVDYCIYGLKSQKYALVYYSDGTRSNIFDPGCVGSIFCCSGWVGSGQPSLVWKISPKNPNFFNFFHSGQKKSLRVGSKIDRPLIY